MERHKRYFDCNSWSSLCKFDCVWDDVKEDTFINLKVWVHRFYCRTQIIFNHMGNIFWLHTVLKLLEVFCEVGREVFCTMACEFWFVLFAVDLVVHELGSGHKLHRFWAWPNYENSLRYVLNQTFIAFLVRLFKFFWFISHVKAQNSVEIDVWSALSDWSKTVPLLFILWQSFLIHFPMKFLLSYNHRIVNWLLILFPLAELPHVFSHIYYRIQRRHSFVRKCVRQHTLK